MLLLLRGGLGCCLLLVVVVVKVAVCIRIRLLVDDHSCGSPQGAMGTHEPCIPLISRLAV